MPLGISTVYTRRSQPTLSPDRRSRLYNFLMRIWIYITSKAQQLTAAETTVVAICQSLKYHCPKIKDRLQECLARMAGVMFH